MREAEEEIGLRVAAGGPDTPRAPVRERARVVSDNEVQDVFAVRSDLPLDAYSLHPDEVDAVVAVGLDEALALFDGSVRRRAPAWSSGARPRRPSAIVVTVTGFAAGEVGGYAALALRGLREVVHGATPEPFELR